MSIILFANVFQRILLIQFTRGGEKRELTESGETERVPKKVSRRPTNVSVLWLPRRFIQDVHLLYKFVFN